ncbi:Golgi apparatus membrane protein TVP15 [Hypoxylon argillaceum]|nr:Golgi apparatus membrane protein TVP15 [Hypoxylon argillaceum]
MDFSDSFRIVNLVVGAVMLFGGITQFIHPTFGISESIILGVYVVIFGAIVGLLEFHRPKYRATRLLCSPSSAVESVRVALRLFPSNLKRFLLRHSLYIFTGSILLSGHPIRYVAGSIIGAVGVVYAALEFVPSIEPPANMREADQGWGAEQV